MRRRRADLIGDGMIGDYVALHWLEWNGGALRLTVAGEAVCDQLNAEARKGVEFRAPLTHISTER